MNMGTVITMVRNPLRGYHEDLLEIQDDLLIYSYADQAMLELRKELKRPVKAQNLNCVTGEVGVNMPSDFLELVDEHVPRLWEATDSDEFEGRPFPIISDVNFHQ